MSKITKAAVLGDGGWGTTLAILLSKKGLEVGLWGAFPDYVHYLRRKRENVKFLPKIKIPQSILISSDMEEVISNARIVILAIPSQYIRRVLKELKRFYPVRYTNLKNNKAKLSNGVNLPKSILLSATKGIENKTLMRMSEVIEDELGKVRLVVLSGPTIAYEVARGIPTTAVVSSKDRYAAREIQGLFMGKSFRLYTNPDIIGVELGGSLKNIIAIAAGISDGLGFGTNTKAALLTRGLAEISRLGVAMGAREETFGGVSGLGDLVTTCISPYSRNRFVGEEIAKGKRLEKIIEDMEMVAEGIPTTKSAYQLSKRYNVQMPITKEVYLVLYRGKSSLKAVNDLMTRERKQE